MSLNQIDAVWREIHGALKAGWGRVFGDAATHAAGRREATVARMQRRYGLTREEATSAEECLREPGVLDDWNDTRSNLGM
jgi:uncharacterized protein YjbJ (UPF0337 family)